MATERIQKILAQAGVSSRRAAERLIVEGRVRVDGRIVTELGSKADPKSKIELDGKRLVRDQLCYGVMNKPRGMLTTLSDPEGRSTVGAILKQVGMRVIPVGRLDYNTSGVLLFTNDGDFAQGLVHARAKVPKVYVAKVTGELNERELARWAEQIEIDGRKTAPAAVRALRRERGHTWLEVTIFEGRNRQVRRLGEHAGTPLVRLVRVSHAGIDAEGLRPGEWRLLTVDELKELKAGYGVPKKIRGAAQGLAQTEGQRNAVSREKIERSRARRAAPLTGPEGNKGRERTQARGDSRVASRDETNTERGLRGPRPVSGLGERGTHRSHPGREEGGRGTGKAARVQERAPRGAKIGGDTAQSRPRGGVAARRSEKKIGAVNRRETAPGPRPGARGRESGPRPKTRR